MYSHSVTNPCELPSHRERSHENAKQMIPRSPIVKLSTFLLPIYIQLKLIQKFDSLRDIFHFVPILLSKNIDYIFIVWKIWRK